MDNACVYVHLKVAYFWFMFGHGLLGFFFLHNKKLCIYQKICIQCGLFYHSPSKMLKVRISDFIITCLIQRQRWGKKKEERMISLHLEIYILFCLRVHKWYFSIFVSKCYLIAVELLQINQFLFPTWTCSKMNNKSKAETFWTVSCM